MSRHIVVLPDFQMPYDDRKLVRSLVKFIGDYQPDEVVHIGDLMDYPQPSRWTRGTAAEFEGSIFSDSDQAKRRFLEPLRDVYDKPVGVHEGNHDLRPREYLAKNSPALAESGAFNLETLLDFDGFGITRLPEFYDIAPGWKSTHGHRGGIRLSQIAGSTALNAAKKMLHSVVCGHTHRLGLSSYTYGSGGNTKLVVTGLEVGNAMNMKLAGYLKGGTANWQQGFGILTVDGQHVKPQAVPILKGRFTVDNYSWSVE